LPADKARTPRRADVRKTHKLFVGGAFPRSESGRTYEVVDARGRFLANAAAASRKDARDAVVAAHGAFGGWAGASAHNRGQVIYRIAEMLESRRPQFVEEIQRTEGGTRRTAGLTVDRAVDRLVWYAGWPDKLPQVLGSANPVAGPYFNFSIPEPTGVVAVLAPRQSSLLGLVSVIAPVLAGANTCVVLASEERPLPAITLAEVIATSDVPGGDVNILTGPVADTAPWLASHIDVNAIDLTGAAGDPDLARELEVAAAGNLKRLLRAPAEEPDWTADPGLDRMRAFLEIKTVWHPT